MKKLYTIFAAILLTGSIAFAEIVDESKAETIAARWLGCEPVLCWEGPQTKADQEALFYVYNNPQGGWVMISAEDVLCPILAYSEEGEFKCRGMPLHISRWIDGYVRTIREVRESKVQATPQTVQLWQTAGYRTKADGGKLLQTADWGQDSPYNLLCPKVTESGREVTAVTGCVATAMSIVCRYHQWPEKGKGTIGGYSYKSSAGVNVHIPSYSIDDHSYDYSLMPLKYTSSASTAQKNAVAQLMHDNGVMVEAEYNYYYGTGALSQNISNALFKHMSYSGKARLEYRSQYSDVEWITMIKNEIDSDRPILYGGYDPDNGGHQFVCDGYDTKDYIHINWGWSSADNGYFTLKLSIPGDCTFNEMQDMVVGLEPDRDGTTTASGGPLCFINYGSGKGLELVSGSIASKSFTVKAGSMYNQNEYLAYKGSIRIALLDKNGKLKEVVSDVKSVTIAAGALSTIASIKCSISTSTLEFGDVVIVQFKDSDGEWKKVRSDNEYQGEAFGTLPYIDAPFIKLESSYNAGDRLYFELSGTGRSINAISWTFDGSPQSGVFVELSSGSHTLTATVSYTDGTTDVITATITL